MRNAFISIGVATAIVVSIILFPFTAYSGTISVLPMTDRIGLDTNNDGIYETIEPEWLEYSRVSDGGYSPYYHTSRVAMEFDLSFLSNNSTINAAYLSFRPIGWSDSDAGLEVHGYYGDGVITGNDMLSTNFIDGPFRPRDISGVFTIDVTSLVNGMGVNEYLGFMFGTYPGFNNFYIDIASKEFSYDPSYRPTLTIDYTVVPLPPAAWLFSTGLIGLIGIARRWKA